MSEPIPFDLTGELPGPGVHVLEASAGTGKTFTIAALATRLLAEGLPLSTILMVTFGRSATSELKARVRDRLDLTETALRHRLAGRHDELERLSTGDEVLATLCSGDHEQVAARLHRISTALSDFDTATIATTHEFCAKMLQGLGILAPVDPERVLVEDVADLVSEVASDLWLRKFAPSDQAPSLPWPEALKIATEVTNRSGAPVPDDADNAERVRFAEAVRTELATRKSRLGLHTYDDQLTDLQKVLCGDDQQRADAARQRLRETFSVVMIDEFQDTDPVQWDIVSSAFGTGSTLVLIGDPKQAIYGFRDAEVQSYLKAVAAPEATHYSLDKNWRSDAPLVEALGTVLGSTELGDRRIKVRPVTAQHRESRLLPGSEEFAAPLRIRSLVRTREVERLGLADSMVRDLVGDIAGLLNSGTRTTIGGIERPVEPHDVAVLVPANWQAEKIRGALVEAGIPAIFNGATSVYLSPACDDWLTLLTALDSPRSGNVRAAALTAFHGWTFAELAQADEQALNRLSARTRWWARLVTDHGISALVEELTDDGLSERVLALTGGDRQLTDLHHLGQLLHAQQTRHQSGIAGLIEWLENRRREKGGGDDRTRRLETDSAAVQIMTLHRSKGLQFPIVYLPYLWRDGPPQSSRDKPPLNFHDDLGNPVIDIGGAQPGRLQRERRWRAEEQGEALRCAYVAMTRAQCQLVLHWVPDKKNLPESSLQRLLCGPGEGAPESGYSWQQTPDSIPRLRHRYISITEVTDPRPTKVAARPHGDVDELRLRDFDRAVDTAWRRTSYSGLTAAAHHLAPASPATGALATSEIEGTETDEPDQSVDESADGESLKIVPPVPAEIRSLAAGLDLPSPMAGLPRGTEFGTLVHAIYEEFDPTSGDLLAELTSHAARWLQRYPMTGLGPSELAEALLPGTTTGLGAIADDLRLADIAPSDRLAELDFEYPLAGGDRPTALIRLRDVADLLAAHLPADDVLADYPQRLRDPELGEEVLRGFLIGSIDAVLRVGAARPGQTPDPRRYLVVDYKTNWLGPPGEELLVGHYTPRAMASAMMDSHYPLQALLYCVALHRFLRWRLPHYDPEVHLGGVAYLFVRGMAGDRTPVVDQMPCGVFTWHPGAALVQALSDLIDQGAR